MRYLGSKIKLLSSIEAVIEENGIQGETFADLFAGTGVVGDYFKNKYKIISNDFLYYAYVINKAKLENSGVPKFDSFVKSKKEDIFVWLNNLSFHPDDTYFVYNNYTPKGGRMFFSESNGIKIDGLRLIIEELYRDGLVNNAEYYFLIASLLDSMTKVSNTSGTYEAFFKFWDSRAEKELVLEPIDITEATLKDENIVLNEDTNSLIRTISGDIAYIDPPYTVTQYVSAYHMFETVAKYDRPEIKGVGGKRGRGDKNSLYAQRTKAKNAFEDLFRQLQFRHVLISYSNQGLVPIEELCELASHFAVDGKVKINHFDYREYQNHRSSNKRNGKSLNEVIIYFEKDLSINKSPINYSGSKDTLLPMILKELPPNIGTFVDVMGGAFNVGANVTAINKVVYNEINPFIYDLVRWACDTDKTEKIESIERIIEEYEMEKGNKESYLKLRDAYNLEPTNEGLYVLHMYAFQNMIRFNSNLKFNTPIGVAGYSEDIKQRLLRFVPKCKNVEFSNNDYVNIDWNSFEENTLFYFDPPYFITSAAYNDGKRGMKGWGSKEEEELLNILSMLDSKGYKFLLSNVIEHKGKTHNLLLKWANEHQYKIINVGVSGWRYAKNEVLIKNY